MSTVTRKIKESPVLSVLLCALPAALAGVIMALSRIDANITERVYSRTIFPVISSAIGLVASIFPFSIIGIVIWCAVPVVLLWIAHVVRRLKKSGDRRSVWLSALRTVVFVPSLIFFIFAVTCAPNFSRLTFAEQSGLPVRDSTSDELAELCGDLIEKTVSAREEISEQDGVFSAGEFKTLSQDALEAFSALREDYPFFQRVYVAPKVMPESEVLSYIETTGFYSCFTSEPNVNTRMPDLELPFTMCHELAHTSGFMREDEANFIGYLACKKSGNPALRYSGLICALNYSMNQLYKVDKARYTELRAAYSEGMERDLAQLNAYWQPYFRTATAKTYSKVNDAFLKLNNQSDGRQSYGRMVDLLLAEYRTGKD